MPEYHTNTEVIKVTLSDHYLTLSNIKPFNNTTRNNILTCRSFKTFNEAEFIADIEQCFSNFTACDDSSLESAWTKWKSNFLLICDTHAPLCRYRIKSNSKPWIDNEIISIMKKRDHVHKLATMSKSEIIFAEYKTLRNKCTQQIRNKKQEYIQNHIANNNGSPKTFWKIVKMLKGDKHSSNSIPSEMTSSILNDHFASIGSLLTSKFTDKLPPWNLPDSVYTFQIEPIFREFISKQLTLLGNRANTDILGIDAKLLHISREYISSSLCSLYNISLNEGYVPDDWKIAKITPIYKGKGSKLDPSNYRPISVISHISKVIERFINKQCLTYLESYNLLSVQQSAFLKQKSTITALHNVNDLWLDNIEHGLFTTVCYFDIKKCFDTLTHNILLFKLQKYGFCEKTIIWFESYLKNRTHVTICHNIISDSQTVNVGIPQGSVLGPVLFLLYMNDLPNVVSASLISLFADDTMLSSSSDNLDSALQLLQQEVNSVSQWFDDNKLALNISKCNTMLIGSAPRISTDAFSETLGISMHNELIENTDEYCYLGLTVDSCLRWENHILKLCKKLSPVVCHLQRISLHLTTEQISSLYFSYVQPIIDYGLTIYGHCSATLLDKVQRFQNRCARFTTKIFDYNVRSKDLLIKLRWMTIAQRRDFLISILMFKCLHGLAPDYLSDPLVYTHDIHSHNTRQAAQNCLFVPSGRTTYFQHSFQVQGQKLWNTLTPYIKEAPTPEIFKYRYRQWLFTNTS